MDNAIQGSRAQVIANLNIRRKNGLEPIATWAVDCKSMAGSDNKMLKICATASASKSNLDNVAIHRAKITDNTHNGCCMSRKQLIANLKISNVYSTAGKKLHECPRKQALW